MGSLVLRQKRMMLPALRKRLHKTTYTRTSSSASSRACATDANHNFSMPLRLHSGIQRMAHAMGEGLVRCEEAILLPHRTERMSIGAPTSIRPSAKWSPTSARHGTIRLRCRLPSLLPLLEAAMVSKQIGMVLHQPAEGMPVQHSSMIRTSEDNSM